MENPRILCNKAADAPLPETYSRQAQEPLVLPVLQGPDRKSTFFNGKGATMASAAAIVQLQTDLAALTAKVDGGLAELSAGDVALNVRDLDVSWLVLCGERRAPSAERRAPHARKSARARRAAPGPN